jgi:predicted PhzF superfamily epimerase YddE/YHI9
MTYKFEQEKENLKKNMTVRLKQKKEAATVKLKQKAQEDTSVLVQKHSAEMLELLKIKQEEIKNELQGELVSTGVTIIPG